MRFTSIRHGLALLIIAAVAVPALAQKPAAPAAATPPQSEFTNLKVLPKDIPPAELRATMNGFTRALGVRCLYCHVGEEGKPFRHEDFAKDDKPTKLKAREMMKMVADINGKYLAGLEHRAEPPIKVECVTCHHGNSQPRTLQAVLQHSYDTGGLDSTLARYHALRDRYYGRFTYDFSEVPLADVGGALLESGHAADAESLLAFNVAMNPTSMFAKRQYVLATITDAFAGGGANGPAVLHAMRDRYTETLVSEAMINQLGYDLLGRHDNAGALAVFRANVADHPASGNAYDSMADALAQTGDKKGAIAGYRKELELDPTNANAKQKLDELQHPRHAKPAAKEK